MKHPPSLSKDCHSSDVFSQARFPTSCLLTWPHANPTEHHDRVNSKYRMSVIKRARQAVFQAALLPPVVAPAHDLARHIQIVNACLADAILEKDPLASMMRDALDELIYFHNRVAPISIFGLSNKVHVSETAKELYAAMPAMRAYVYISNHLGAANVAHHRHTSSPLHLITSAPLHLITDTTFTLIRFPPASSYMDRRMDKLNLSYITINNNYGFIVSRLLLKAHCVSIFMRALEAVRAKHRATISARRVYEETEEFNASFTASERRLAMPFGIILHLALRLKASFA